jgi:hypothetical protein
METKTMQQPTTDREDDLLEALANAMAPVLAVGLTKLDAKQTKVVGGLLANGTAHIRVTIDSDSTLRVRGDLVSGPDLVALGYTSTTELFTLRPAPKK